MRRGLWVVPLVNGMNTRCPAMPVCDRCVPNSKCTALKESVSEDRFAWEAVSRACSPAGTAVNSSWYTESVCNVFAIEERENRAKTTDTPSGTQRTFNDLILVDRTPGLEVRSVSDVKPICMVAFSTAEKHLRMEWASSS